MTLDEAIIHAKLKANEQRHYSQFEKVRNSCIKCAEEHEQLAEWLEELKEYKELEEKGLLIKLSSTEDVYCIENIIKCKYDYSLDKCPMYSKCGYCGSEENNFISCKHQYIMPVIVHRAFNMTMLPKLGKSIFFARENAEKELERLESAE